MTRLMLQYVLFSAVLIYNIQMVYLVDLRVKQIQYKSAQKKMILDKRVNVTLAPVCSLYPIEILFFVKQPYYPLNEG